MFDSIKNEISNLSKSKILIDEPLKKHTTFGVGGKASIFIAGDITPAVREETITHELVHYFHDILCLNVDTEDLAQKIEKMAQE